MSDVRDTISINLDNLKNNNDPRVSGSYSVLAALNFKNATEVDPSTGIKEINQNNQQVVKQAISNYFLLTVGRGDVPDSTDAGRLSYSDIETAVGAALKTADSGKNGFSLTLSGLVNQSYDTNQSGPNGSGNVGVVYNSYATTATLSISPQGVFTTTLDSHNVILSQGVETIQGSADAPAQNRGTTPLVQDYSTDPLAYGEGSFAEPAGITVTKSLSLSFVEGGTYTYVAPTTGVTTVQAVLKAGSVQRTYQFDQSGTHAISATTQDDTAALAASQSLSVFEAAIAATAKDAAAAAAKDKSVTLIVKSQIGALVTDASGSKAIFYTRPDGTTGRITVPTVDTTA